MLRTDNFTPEQVAFLIEQLLSGDFLAKRWLDVKDKKPPARTRLYVIAGDGCNHRFYQTIAEYIPHKHVTAEEYYADEVEGNPFYCEKDDEYYAAEGWYEHEIATEYNWYMDDHVFFWMPLFPMPEYFNQK